MPIYEYRCRQCGNEFEVIQNIDDKQPPCPKCASEDREEPVHNQYRAELLRRAQEITFFLKVERGNGVAVLQK